MTMSTVTTMRAQDKYLRATPTSLHVFYFCECVCIAIALPSLMCVVAFYHCCAQVCRVSSLVSHMCRLMCCMSYGLPAKHMVCYRTLLLCIACCMLSIVLAIVHWLRSIRFLRCLSCNCTARKSHASRLCACRLRHLSPC